MEYFSRLLAVSFFLVVFSSHAEESLTPAAGDSAALKLVPVKFAEGLQVEKVEAECAMLKSITDSILASANSYSLKVDYREYEAAVAKQEAVLLVEFESVTANKFGVFALRPMSIATVKASIVKDGVVIDQFSKAISSRVALGACDRLEKIAVAGGREVAKWASKSQR